MGVVEAELEKVIEEYEKLLTSARRAESPQQEWLQGHVTGLQHALTILKNGAHARRAIEPARSRAMGHKPQASAPIS